MNNTICGIDEAGRGPLAGPVSAGCVVLPADFPLEVLNDSKQLSAKHRTEAEKIIKERAIWAVGWANHKEIDSLNILNATYLAMRRAYIKVAAQIEISKALVDGNRVPPLDIPCEAIVKGDAKVSAIMAASILAKEARDRFMTQMETLYPGYGFAHHKGYPTKSHRDAIKKMGPSPIHRMSFTLVDEQLTLF